MINETREIAMQYTKNKSTFTQWFEKSLKWLNFESIKVGIYTEENLEYFVGILHFEISVAYFSSRKYWTCKVKWLNLHLMKYLISRSLLAFRSLHCCVNREVHSLFHFFICLLLFHKSKFHYFNIRNTKKVNETWLKKLKIV